MQANRVLDPRIELRLLWSGWRGFSAVLGAAAGSGLPAWDLLLHYETAQTGIDMGDMQACLTGDTFGGPPITGCDSIKTK